MKFSVRDFNYERDYLDACQWWTAHSAPPLPTKFLPGKGLVVEFNDEKLCMVWLYRTDSALCMIEGCVSNPESNLLVRSQGLDILLKSMLEYALGEGFKAMFTTTTHARIAGRLQQHGFYKIGEVLTKELT